MKYYLTFTGEQTLELNYAGDIWIELENHYGGEDNADDSLLFETMLWGECANDGDEYTNEDFTIKAIADHHSEDNTMTAYEAIRLINEWGIHFDYLVYLHDNELTAPYGKNDVDVYRMNHESDYRTLISKDARNFSLCISDYDDTHMRLEMCVGNGNTSQSVLSFTDLSKEEKEHFLDVMRKEAEVHKREDREHEEAELRKKEAELRKKEDIKRRGLTFIAELKQTRVSQNLSLVQLGELSGVSYSTISDIENGKSNPSLKVLTQLATALGKQITLK